jgi:Family of unknown function (DUF6492)
VTEQSERLAIVTPSFARDFERCRELNESIVACAPAGATHYVIVDARDLSLFKRLENERTVVAAIEEVVPRGFFKLPYSKWWLSARALYPAKGWLVQQLAKLSAHRIFSERVQINVDSDVRFVRPFDASLFVRDGKTRLYRLPGGVHAGMEHVKWHPRVCRLLGVTPDALPMDDYVGNVISWDRAVVARALDRVERITTSPWHVAFTRARLVSEYLLYGLYVDKVSGPQAAGVWHDDRSWCHTYWGPAPLHASAVEGFARAMLPDDIAISIAGYSGTPPEVTRAATTLALRLAAT